MIPSGICPASFSLLLPTSFGPLSLSDQTFSLSEIINGSCYLLVFAPVWAITRCHIEESPICPHGCLAAMWEYHWLLDQIQIRSGDHHFASMLPPQRHWGLDLLSVSLLMQYVPLLTRRWPSSPCSPADRAHRISGCLCLAGGPRASPICRGANQVSGANWAMTCGAHKMALLLSVHSMGGKCRYGVGGANSSKVPGLVVPIPG